MHELKGGCHCGNLHVTYRTAVAPAAATLRACQCAFCRKHATRAVSDPAGSLSITVRDGELLERYQFGLRAADFLICRKCGVYVAAFMADGDAGYATLMVNVLDDHAAYAGAPTPVEYGTEDEAGRRRRRREAWTPATLSVG
ncbi:MAG TPA: hypothetical protein VGA19_08605 [Rhodospirillales bacterium]